MASSPKPPSYVKRNKTPAIGAPTTESRLLNQFLQNVRERIDALDRADFATSISNVTARVVDLESTSGSSGSTSSSVGSVTYQGDWDASSGSAPASGPSKGDYYYVEVAGTTSLSGISTWYVGDWAVWNGSAWQAVRNQQIAAGDNISVSFSGGTVTISSTASGTAEATPTYIPEGSTTTVAENTQMLYALPITVDGTLTVVGDLVEVSLA